MENIQAGRKSHFFTLSHSVSASRVYYLLGILRNSYGIYSILTSMGSMPFENIKRSLLCFHPMWTAILPGPAHLPSDYNIGDQLNPRRLSGPVDSCLTHINGHFRIPAPMQCGWPSCHGICLRRRSGDRDAGSVASACATSLTGKKLSPDPRAVPGPGATSTGNYNTAAFPGSQ